jgi:hypothetical protein
MKYCDECKWFKRATFKQSGRCLHPNVAHHSLEQYISVAFAPYAMEERRYGLPNDGKGCGPEGKNWEAKT